MTSRDSCDKKLIPRSLKFVMAAPAVYKNAPIRPASDVGV
jgi:hypothetical protein